MYYCKKILPHYPSMISQTKELLSKDVAICLLEKRLNAQVTVVDNLVLEGLLHIALQSATRSRT